MDETIEEVILKILNQVSEAERSRNIALVKKTARVLKALEYMKAIVGNKNILSGKLGA